MSSLSDALAQLERITKGEGVVSMNSEQLAGYAQTQITKMTTDADGGTARRTHLEGVLADALDVLKLDSTSEVEFVPYTEPAVEKRAELDPNVAALTESVSKLVGLFAKQAPAAAMGGESDNESGNPTSDTVHPPPVPEGHGATDTTVGSAVATNQPQGDDGTPRDQIDKGLGSDNAARGGVTVEREDEDEDEFVWPSDLNTVAFRKDLAKNSPDTRPFWGFDDEATPTDMPRNAG